MNKNTPCCDGILNWMPPELFKALSDPRRVAIVAQLANSDGEQTVSDLANCCPVDISVVSRHLKTLRHAGICEANKRGKEVFYRIRVKKLVTVLRNLANALESCSPEGVCEVKGAPHEA